MLQRCDTEHRYLTLLFRRIASATISVWEYNTKRWSLEKVASTTLANTSAIEISSSCLAGGLFIYCNNRQNTVNIWDFTAGLWAVLSAPSTFSTLSGTLAEVSAGLDFSRALKDVANYLGYHR